MAALVFWSLVPFSLPVRLIAAVAALSISYLLVQLRFLASMTVALWTRLWGSLAPLFLGSLVSLPFLPVAPLVFLPFLFLMILLIGIWAAYRFYPLLADTRLHTSRFARIDEVETLLCRAPVNDGLILGSIKQFFLFRQYVCVRPTKAKPEIGHSLVIGPSGGGKTTEMIGQITALDHYSMIITDPKGELFLQTAGHRAKQGPVIVLDPTRGVGHCYDPFQGMITEDEYTTIAKILVFQEQDSIPFWNNSAENMIVQLLKAARIEKVSPMIYLRHMIDLGLPAVAKRLNSLDPKIATAFLGKDDATNDTIFGIWTTLQSHLRQVLTETLVRCFTTSDFSAETILRGPRPVTIYLRLQEGHLKRLSPFVRLMIESFMKELIATWEKYQGKGCRKVFFDLEEAGIFPIPNLAEYVSTGRSKGFVFKLYYQALTQLEKNYGEKDASTIMANMDTKEFLRPNDKDIAKEIVEWLGQGSQFSESINKRQGQGSELVSETLSEQAIPVMSAPAIMEMPDTYVIVKHREFKPLKLYRLKWWESTLLKKRVGLRPPVLQALPHIPDLPQSVKGAANVKEEHEVFSTDFTCENPDAIKSRRPRREEEEEPER